MMTPPSSTPRAQRIYVRVVSNPGPAGLQEAINATLEEEYTRGAELVDIKLTSRPPGGGQRLSSSAAEHVALLLFRSGQTEGPMRLVGEGHLPAEEC